MTEARTEIGRVRSVNPSRREVRVTPRKGFEKAFAKKADIEFGIHGGKRATYAVDTVEEQQRCVKLTLAQSVSMDTVASLRGARVYAGAAPVTPDDPFEAEAREFEGFSVVDAKGQPVGVVESGFNTAAHGVIEIARGGGRKLLAPFVPEVIEEVDWPGRKIVIRDIEAHVVEVDGGTETA